MTRISHIAVAVIVNLGGTLSAMADPVSTLEAEIYQLQSALLYGEAIDRLMSIDAAASDAALASRLLGEAYTNGFGVEKNLESAVQYYRTAANAGEPKAQYLLGQAYEYGHGIPASAASAFTWYDTAALTSPDAALRYAEIALANQHRKSFVVRHDPVDRLRYAADSGLAMAKYILGTLLVRGEMVPKDPEEAMSLLEHAAQTLPNARTALATLHHQNKEYERAKKLFEQAATGGDPTAAAFLGHYAEYGIGEPIDRRKALNLYGKSQGVEWAAEGNRRLTEHFISIEMFGIRMYGMTRAPLKNLLKGAGIRRIGGEPHFDAYDVSHQVGRNGIMTVAYAPGHPGYVAEISYRFDVDNSRKVLEMYDELVASLTNQYGIPGREQRKRGDKKIRWERGSASIQLDYLSGEKYLTVTYHLRPYSLELNQYVERLRRSEKGVIEDAL